MFWSGGEGDGGGLGETGKIEQTSEGSGGVWGNVERGGEMREVKGRRSTYHPACPEHGSQLQSIHRTTC